MTGLFRSAWALAASLLFALAISGASAAERNISLLPGIDLPGFDYEVIKDTDLDSCSATCEGDNLCRAFTFNTKAKWCFLKGDVGPEAPFADATSGRVDISPNPATTAAERQSEIPFPAQDLIDVARSFARDLPVTDTPPPNATYTDLVTAAQDAAAADNPSGAIVSYRQALAVVGNDPVVWQALADQLLKRAEQVKGKEGDNSYDLAYAATSAALNAFLKIESNVRDRAAGLASLAKALEFREMWRESIATYRASLALADNADLQARLDKVVAEHGFRITSNSVDAEAATPRICAQFSDPLPTGDVDLSGYVVVEGAPQVAVESEQTQICVEGLQHGQRYHVTFRAGLPSSDGEELRNNVDLNLYVPDRAPFVGFANNAYVMPSGLGGGLPITSVNAEVADVVIYRIGDRSIATAVRNGIFQRTLDGYSAEDIANSYGEKGFEGQVDLAQGAANELTTTAIPVGEVLDSLAPGVYVITAKVANSNQDYWQELATQWFVVTDLGLTTVEGDDGVHAFVRSLTSAQPVAGVKVRMIAINNDVLGEGTTDAEGRAVFAPGLARGEGGKAPQLLVAETTGGDYAFLDVNKPAFDLTDRGVEGRPSPGPLDLYATTERGVYRPGETVFLTAILRDDHALAVTGLPLTVEVERPDGVVANRILIEDQGAGGYFRPIDLVPEAMRGSWHIKMYADPKAAPLANLTFLVEDFEPERLAFDVSAPDAPIAIDGSADISIAARYLYGATAPNLNVEADAVIRPTSSLADYPGYTFGRVDDTFQTTREPLGVVGITDEEGNATAAVSLPELSPTTRPLEAQLLLRLVDSNGRTVERSLTRPVLADVDRIGIKPQFNEYEGLDEGSTANFDVIVVAPDGETIDKAGLTWTLSRIETNYQWYRDSGIWKWEAITTTRQVANGTVDATASGPVTVGGPVDWGQYVLEVESSGEGATSSSYEFYAGYYYPEPGSNTPDRLQVALDKASYRPGETANLRIDPQFAGTALVMVIDNRVIDMVTVEVPADGTTVALPVTADWGPGAYVTAMLYRPADATEKRMPARALGLAFADVDPGDLKLNVDLEVPAEALPRETMTATIRIDNVKPGEQAYVAVAAVDLGILNLTNFPIPDPDGWFFGQRQLGMEIRDLYGQLIDPTQGIPGAIRSGGDEGAARVGTPPAITTLVALHSGVVTVGPDGTATVEFDMPDFNGTVRIMAMAWSASGVGHAAKDTIVHDPVVVNLSPPRFLRVGDVSRLLVEIDNVSGPAGAYRVELETGEGLSTDAADQTVELAAGGRVALNLGLTGTGIGDNELTLTVTGPNGDVQTKQLVLGVRAASGPRTTSRLLTIATGESITIDASYFAGLLEHSASLTLAVGPIARLDVPGVLTALDRYPYGCVEQVSSRAFPLLYLNEVAEMLGMGTDDAIAQRIRDAIADVLSKQTSSGAFGLWGPFSYTDLWLDSYVTEFLLRAKDEGYEISEQALNMALDNLGNQVSYAADFSDGGEAIAYALYDLARAGRAAIGDLRYYLEARLDAFATPLAKAQLGAALALYGDRTRAATAFAAAVADLQQPEERNSYRVDYGSRLRDTAAVLALAAEAKPAGVDIGALTELLADLRDAEQWTSTQEDAWTLIAAAQLARDATSGSVSIDGVELSGTAYQRYDQEDFDNDSVTITNNGNTPTEVKVSVTGIPATPPPASSQGFTIQRDYYLPDGTWVDPTTETVTQNDRFVVVLTLSTQALGSGQYVVSDPLPAGFEIENPDLSMGAGVGDLSWLSVYTPAHVESRTDQYVAAFRYYSDTFNFSTAYMVRAVSPGQFVLPGATIEDMYRPERRANTEASRIVIASPGTAVVTTGGEVTAPPPAETPEQSEAQVEKEKTKN